MSGGGGGLRQSRRWREEDRGRSADSKELGDARRGCRTCWSRGRSADSSSSGDEETCLGKKRPRAPLEGSVVKYSSELTGLEGKEERKNKNEKTPCFQVENSANYVIERPGD